MSEVSPARAVAFDVVRQTFEDEAHTERVFAEAVAAQGLEGRERAQAQRLAYGAVQRRATSDAAVSRLGNRSLRRIDPPVLNGLRLGLFELLFSDGTPDHAAVDQAVELVKRASAPHAAGFVNAVLRRAARERDRLTASLLGDDSNPDAAAIAHSAPTWLTRMWWEELGADVARSLLAACNEPAETAFRVNTLMTDRETVLAKLEEAGVEAGLPSGEWPLAAVEMLVVRGRTGKTVPEMVAAGVLTPQSRGSAAVIEVLDPQPEESILDLCAGPGIKTGQIAARMNDRGEVISVEQDPDRAVEVADQARRLGLRSVTVIEADGTRPSLEPGGFDRVLLDAPCSDLGALASRPDARWRKSPASIERLVEVQAQLLRRAREALRPGGTLVYSTCTISRRENEEQIAGGECWQLRPDRDCTTGFFIARLNRDDD